MFLRLNLSLVRSIGQIFRIFLDLFMISEGKRAFEGSNNTKFARGLKISRLKK